MQLLFLAIQYCGATHVLFDFDFFFRARQIYRTQKDMKSSKCLFSCLQTVFFINGVSGMLFGRELNLVGNPFILYLQYPFLLISRGI
jgi:hypothetical protein